MDMQNVIELINGVGFPIFVALILLWMNRENVRQTRELVDRTNKAMRENTEALLSLLNKINCRGRDDTK